ncbi:MAG: DUF3108 domain-containing protein [Desulfovibrionaceae bacterium]
MRLRAWAFWLCLMFISQAAGAEPRTGEPTEALRFNMYWGPIPVGSAMLTDASASDAEGRPIRRIRLTCNSNFFVDLFCKVRDSLESVAARDLSRSMAYNKSLREGSVHRRFSTRLDWVRRRSIRLDLLDNSTLSRHLPESALDPLAVFYDFRQRFLQGSHAMQADVTDGLYLVKARARMVGRERISVPYGTFDARKAQVCMPHVDGIFRASEPGCFFVWISDDRRGLPLILQAKVRVAGFLGDLSVELAGVESDQAQTKE